MSVILVGNVLELFRDAQIGINIRTSLPEQPAPLGFWGEKVQLYFQRNWCGFPKTLVFSIWLYI